MIRATAKGLIYAFRSAVTGRFISKDEADRKPKQTVRESRPARMTVHRGAPPANPRRRKK